MRFYRATRFLFPTDLRMRLFLVCFIGTHVPLIVFVLWQLALGHFGWRDTGVLVIATLAGTAFALSAINWLLVPVRRSTEALDALGEGEWPVLEECDGRDLMGALITSVNRAATATHDLVDQLDEAAHRDPLTGLWNRRGFEARVAEVAHCYDYSALAIVDLDHFKAVNDTYGHRAGDDVLRLFSHRLVGALRRGDLIARWGGEEFVVLLTGATVRESTGILERLAQSLRDEPLDVPGGADVRFSGGVAPYGMRGMDTALMTADRALYRAKRGGRDRIEPVLAEVP
ncbi:GGDEF domain-containing protein [Stakelama sp. CBK3Z-3]|uniref:diguanylate cyclase n=1 Tax=Stakelama flava TaxID=2860338 RepID=A0ABS6XH69_9SPHN|nr:GGDEF domain-containing protein [Stakelama flava]MBW4329567.1 GGDEF domain-containing protein [Stakelama flava]